MRHSRNAATPPRRAGRVLVVSVRRKHPRKKGKYRKEYLVRIVAANGRQIGTAGESYVRRDHAIEAARGFARSQFYARGGRPWKVYVEGKEA